MLLERIRCRHTLFAYDNMIELLRTYATHIDYCLMPHIRHRFDTSYTYIQLQFSTLLRHMKLAAGYTCSLAKVASYYRLQAGVTPPARLLRCYQLLIVTTSLSWRVS